MTMNKTCCKLNTVRCAAGHPLSLSHTCGRTSRASERDGAAYVCSGRYELSGCRAGSMQQRQTELNRRICHRRRNSDGAAAVTKQECAPTLYPMWICTSGCDFAYCTHCYDGHQETLWKAEGSEVSLIPRREQEHDTSHRRLGDRLTFPECAICFENRPLATLVHGSSGHTICCRPCAIDLVNLKHPCPICRQKVEAIIDVYV